MAKTKTTAETENGYVIKAKDLWRIYKSGIQEVQALRGVDLQIEPGHFVALVGRSGSGKTTLLNIVGGLDQPSKGKVSVFGRELSGMSERKRTRWRREQIGFIFQSFGLLPTLSAYENVELMPRIAGMRAKERKERSLYCLELVGLKKWMDHRPYEMSGGQQQRVAIARALANKPKLILADEPTGELDTSTAREILTLFQHIVAEEGITMLMVSHDSLVDEYVDQVLRLRDGQVVEA
ncbi:MAG: ABC transporter ATP-binding protein [Anaerolineae bacterium]|nr:ABC transporter ATP-binding protein [Anaerolineae bacterium]